MRLFRPKIEMDVKSLKKPEEIVSVPVRAFLHLKADGLVSFRLNGRQPLFFRPAEEAIENIVSVKPDESGTLVIRTDKGLDQAIKVAAGEGEKIDEKDYDPPSRVTGVSGRSERYVLKIVWQPAGDRDFDFYRVYQFKNAQWVKVSEVRIPEYTKKAAPWETFSFRICAVDKAGNEGEPSDLYGIVATPR